MIPKYLKIKGLYSYQKEQEIHFDTLTEASLFGIFGSVGSGKSSILEAITFALYGDTERLNKSGDDRTYNMMNLRSDELLIDFECVAGKNGDRYRFTVKGKRNSKNFKEVKTFERRAYIWQDAWVPLAESVDAEQIIGLSYDNFRRTIIIPQGRFQEFIELKDAERTRMMKELFQLEKYDLSRNVGVLIKKNDLDLSSVEGQLLGLGVVTAEMIAEGEKQREEVRLQIKTIHDELVVQTETEARFQKLKVTAETILLLQNQLKALELEEPVIRQREEALNIFEICSLYFRSFLDQKKSLLLAIARDQQLYQKNVLRSTELQELTVKQRETLHLLQDPYDKREELLDTAGELQKVLLILETLSKTEKKKGALLRGEGQLAEKENAIESLKRQKLDKETENELKKGRLFDIQELSLAKSWFTTLDALYENRTAVKKEADELQAEIAGQQASFKNKIQESVQLFASNLIPDAGIEMVREAVRTSLLLNESKREGLSKRALQLNTTLALQQYAASLADGEACPLCGSVHHPAVIHADQALSVEIAALEMQRVELQKQDELIRQWQYATEKSFTGIENSEKQKGIIKQRWSEVKARIDAHEKAFTWERFDKSDREGFDRHFAEADKNQREIKENDLALKNLSLLIETETKEKTTKIEQPLQLLRNEILSMESTVSTLSGQLLKVSLSDFAGQDPEVISAQIAALKKSYDETKRLYELAEKQIDLLEKERDTIAGGQAILQQALESHQSELTTAQTAIDTQLVSYSLESENQVAEILQKPIRIDVERKAIDAFKSSLNNTKRDLENLNKENPDTVYDAEKHQLASNAKEVLSQNLNVKRKEEGRLDGHILKMNQDLARRALLDTEKARLHVRKEHLDDLGRLFRSSGFVDYASSIYLQNLIQAANNRFHQMTHQQLHLELGDGNSFWVRDLLNGGHMRLLKTLSGGQKFQAALCLALALADHIHIRNESRHNFFFLDEGFGSLDKHALQTVFETLKSLRKENRIVGIISHVEDLQQEIQTYLRITETEEGSKISESWK